MQPNYDFSNPIFQKKRQYIRWAKEHIALAALKSDVIKWEVVEAEGPLKIPTKYHIHYHFKSIVGIKDDKSPVFNDHHVLEMVIPPRYPIEPVKLYMVTDTWHPNISSQGKYKGRVCSNAKNFGRGFDLFQMVLRVGEILQYKNYLAEHVPPFPEDSRVAEWVRDHAEPEGIVNRSEGVVIDDSPLLRPESDSDELQDNFEAESHTPDQVPTAPGGALDKDPPREEQEAERRKITIKDKRKYPQEKRKLTLKITRRNDSDDPK